MTIVSLASGKKYSVEKTLEILDDLRAQIVAGDIVAFSAVGIGHDNRCSRWTASARVMPPLMMSGAIATLQHFYIAEHEEG